MLVIYPSACRGADARERWKETDGDLSMRSQELSCSRLVPSSLMATRPQPTTTKNQEPTTRHNKHNSTLLYSTQPHQSIIMMFSADSSPSDTSASTSPTLSSASPLSTPSTAVSQPEPEPTPFQVFHVEAPRGHHKLFVSTGPQPALGFFFYVIHLPGLDQPMMIAMTDTVSSIQQLATVHDSRLVGSIAAHDMNRLRILIHGLGVPYCPTESDPPNEARRRAERWIYDVVDTLLEDGVLEPPPPPPRPHQLPRHHHTAHCIHQRLHSHHPYRRRGRGRRPVVNNPLMNPSPESRGPREPREH
ncbi:hypothetical protein BHE90_015455 [Fusarium euwallaceae]|uniref:Uncharacterized protein n=1 Tax=Fusarium euwallaceae TaxID=1147111 RepID=A0A430L3E0_9HYPO|nr:hypothetical protein BHE90_015455 [Fusarium euwallaceae]